MSRQRIVAALLLEDVTARHLIGLVVLFCWMTVWSWGCLEVSSADPQAWRLPLGIGAGALAVLGVFGYSVTKKDDLPLGTRVARGVVLAMTSTRPRCLGYIAIGIVLIWLSYRSLTGSIQSVYCNEKEILQWTVIGPERSRTCGTDIVQLWYPFGTPKIRVLDRNDRSLRGYCRIGDHGYVDCLKPEPKSGGSISQPSTKKELVIALFNGGDLQFTRSISAAFSERLQRLANEARIDVRTIWATGPALLPSDARGHDEWLHQIDYAAAYAEQNKIDYLVSIGTQASLAVSTLKGLQRTNAKGFIFLGVTDPEGTGLVTSLHQRKTLDPVAGVRYGSGARDFFDTVAMLFPVDQTLTFIFEKGISQDDYMAKQFEGLSRARTVALDHLPKPTDFTDPNGIYFGWYSVGKMLEQSEGLIALAHHTIVPSTYSPEIMELAGVVVSVDDTEVGTAGAELVYKAFNDPSWRLGEQSILEPKFRIRIDCTRLSARNIKLNPDVYQRAFAKVGDCF